MNGISNLSARTPHSSIVEHVPEDDFVDFGKYWRTILSAKWLIISLTIVGLTLGTITAQHKTPIYQATSKILADPQKPNVNRSERYISSALVVLFYETQYEIIRSRNIAEAAVDKLDLVTKYKLDLRQSAQQPSSPVDKLIKDAQAKFKSLLGTESDPEIEKPLTDAEIKSKLAKHIQSNIEVSGGKQSQIINISYRSEDPEAAKDIVNAIADAYIEFGLETRLGEVKKTEKWLETQYKKLLNKLQTSELTLSQYRKSEGLVNTSQQQQLANNQLQSLNNELLNAQTNLSAAIEQYEEVKLVKIGSEESYALAPVIANKTASDMVKELATRAREVEQLEQRYGELHPKMISARTAYSSTKENLDREVTKIINNVEKKVLLANARVENVKQLITESREGIQQLQESNLELIRLEREVETNRRVYESFQSQLMEANLNSEFDASNIHIIDRATLPEAPSNLNTKFIVGILGILGLMLGVISALIKDSLSNTFNSPDAIEDLLNIPNLGVTPKLNKTDSHDSPETQYINEPGSNFAECINTIRTGLLFSNIDQPPQTILVSSAQTSEGKSTLSLNLAAALSNIGKTLLLEVDLRKPTLSTHLKLETHLGLTDLMTNPSIKMEHLAQNSIKENLTVIASGAIPNNPSELLSSMKFEQLLEQFTQHFDYIILDGPPTIPVSDSCILGNKVDGIVLAIKSNETDVGLVKKTIQRLKNHNANIIGTVLTVLDAKTNNYYDAQYYEQGNYGFKPTAPTKGAH